MTRDVEKRWSDPQTFRRAALYDGATIVLALIAMVVTIADWMIANTVNTATLASR